jgi:cold-inducible RNA-binding protein
LGTFPDQSKATARRQGEEDRAMASKLFVGNLSFQATEEDLRELFQQSGTVESVRIITDQFTGRPRGFGFAEMATKDEATKAIEMLNGRLFRDRNLVVDEARPQPQRGSGAGPRSDRGPRPGGSGGSGGGWRR